MKPWITGQTEVIPYDLYSERTSGLLCAEENFGARVGAVRKLDNNPDAQEKV